MPAISLFARDGVVRTRVRRIRHALLGERACRHRRRLRNCRIIAVTGSVGKSTTVRLVSAILQEAGATASSILFNTRLHIARQVMQLSDEQDFAVFEVSGHMPGHMARCANILRPDIAIVTRVGSDHWKAFRSREAIAAEKSELPAAAMPGGTVVLNADDPLVMAMAARTRANVVTVGKAEGADYRARDISARLPGTLSFTVEHDGETHRIQTRLSGGHWYVVVLSAIAAARAAGAAWDDIKRVLAATPGLAGHGLLYEHDGRYFIVDTAKAPAQDLGPVFEMLDGADVPRRTIVFAQLSDYPGEDRRWYRRAYEAAAQHADRVIVMRPPGTSSVRIPQEHLDRGFAVQAETWQDVSRLMAETALPGELILLKSAKVEHLERAFLHLVEPVTCMIPRCGRTHQCFGCRHLRSTGPPVTRERTNDLEAVI